MGSYIEKGLISWRWKYLEKGKKLRNSIFLLVFVIKFELHHFEKLIFCTDPYIHITVRIRTICKANNPEIRAGIKLIVNKLLKLPDPNHWYSPNRYWMFTTTIFCSSTVCSGCSLFEDSQNDSVNSNSTNFTNRFLVLWRKNARGADFRFFFIFPYPWIPSCPNYFRHKQRNHRECK